jgi:outer membrane lipoprotein SlyB
MPEHFSVMEALIMHVPYQSAAACHDSAMPKSRLLMAWKLHEVTGHSKNEESSMAAFKTVLAVLVLAVLAACSSTLGIGRTAPLEPGDGVIENISVEQGSDSSGAGAVLGAVAGGLLGNQIGGGSGQTAATVAGVAGGAYAGQQIEKNRQGKVQYQLGIRMESGLYQTVTQDTNPFQIGDRVQVIDGKLRRRER